MPEFKRPRNGNPLTLTKRSHNHSKMKESRSTFSGFMVRKRGISCTISEHLGEILKANTNAYNPQPEKCEGPFYAVFNEIPIC